MGEVRVLHGKPPVDASLVALLEELLAEAKAGELCSFVGVADFHAREPEYITAGVMDFWAMRGRLADLAVDLTTEEDDE